ncbi:MAG: aryl-sulfate sulfotransferase, partial [bacterium]|nr:aryl-sulfate sulfotransferase [bacterium]
MRHFVLSAALLFTCTSSLHAYERLQGPTDVVYWDKTKAQTGYTFFGTRGVTYLIDMQGCIVQTWPLGANPRLLDNGNVLDATSLTPDEFRSLAEVSWSGSNVWQYTETRAAYAPHHDFLRIYNKKLGTNTTLYIAAKTVTSNQCIAAGCNPASAPYTNAQVDAIVEIDMAGAVVWEWCFFDHGIQDFDAGKSNYVGSGKTIANYPGRLNLNLPGRPLTKDWLHCTSLDYNTNLDQIVISAEGGEFYVIDHGKTFTAGNPAASIALAAGTNGDFVYRFGDPARHGQGNPPSINLNWTTSTTGNKQIGGVSQVQWIPQGVPGAGNFMVFNNGQDLFETSPQSYIFEVNPFINAGATNTSNYVSPPSAGYSNWAAPGHDTDKRTKQLSRQVIWKYFSMANQGFFSHIGGSVQRMANSNILVCSTAEGHVFEVAQASNVVWEYISPITTNGVVEYKRDTWPMANALARACRYATNHLALIGHTLVPGSTISGRTPAYISAPTISGTGYTPQPPTAVDSIWVTAVISNARAVASATLVYNAGSSNVSVTMLDDGSHNDGANGDSIYGGVIPAFITGTTVRFYITAQDDFSNSATDPASAPGTTFSYVVNLIPEPAGPVVLATGLAWLVRRRGMARGRFVAML